MAHDWLGDLFRRWGRGGNRPRPARIRMEALEDRSVPSGSRVEAPLRLPDYMADGRLRFRPDADWSMSPAEVVAEVRAADPVAYLAAAPGGAGVINLATSNRILTHADGDSLVRVGLTPGADPVAVVRWLESLPAVQWADPSYVTTKDLRAFVPDDKLYRQQAHLPQIGAPAAWDVTTGDESIVVAVMDDGVAINHADLKANIWVNPRDTTQAKGVYVGDDHGWDFISDSPGFFVPAAGDNDPNPVQSFSHGTHVAGLIAATTNNGIGVSGVAGGDGTPGSGARIMPLRVLPGGGVTIAVGAVLFSEAYAYAADNGAKIVNSSIQFEGFVDFNGTVNPAMQSAIEYTTSKGVLHFLAAANSATLEPRKQAFTDVLIVASVASSSGDRDRASDFTDHGSGIDLSAPGSHFANNGFGVSRGITSTLTLNNGTTSDYGSYRLVGGFPELWVGTSMATPVAAGVAALIWSQNPTWTREQVAAQILATSDNIDNRNVANGKAGLLGTGRVNAARAVTETAGAPFFFPDTLPAEGKVLTTPGLPGNAFTLTAPRRFASATVTAGNFELREAGPDGAFNTPDDQVIPLTKTTGAYQVGSNKIGFSVPLLGPGAYRFTARSGGLADPFGTPLDGNRDGVGGDDFVRSFRVAGSGVAGSVFEDGDADGQQALGEGGVAGATVFLDANGNGKLDATEPSTVTDFGGRYQFATLKAGAVTAVGVVPPAGWLPSTAAANPRPVTVPAAGFVNGISFGFVRQNTVYGFVYADADASGTFDPGEGGAGGVRVLYDQNLNGRFDPPVPGPALPYTSTTKVAIPDPGPGLNPVFSDLTISGVGGTIVGLTVRINITHTWVSDLDVEVIAPDGTIIPLFSDVGGSGKNFTGTVFDDAAGTSIAAGSAPFTGTFRPFGRLGVMVGKSANGLWRLRATDFVSFDTGTINEFTLNISTVVGEFTSTTDATGRFRFTPPAGPAGAALLPSRGWLPVTPDQFGVPTPFDLAAGKAVTGLTFGVRPDFTAPTVVSIAPAGRNPTGGPQATFAVTFSEPVVGLTAAQFAVVGLPDSVVVDAEPVGDGTVWTVTVEAGGFDTGTVAIRLVAAGTATDLALNPLDGAFPGPLSPPVTIDRDAPAAQVTGPADRAVFSPSKWTGAVTGTATDATSPVEAVFVSIRRANDNLYFDGTGFTSLTEVRRAATVGSGGAWSLPLAAGVFTGQTGSFFISAYATDAAGNAGLDPGTSTLLIDSTRPTVTITPAGGLVNGATPFTLTFSEPVFDLNPSLVVVSDGGTGVSAEPNATNTVWTVRVVPLSDGPVTVTAEAGVAIDAGDNPSEGPVSVAVTYDGTAPTVSVPADFVVRPAAWAGAFSGSAADAASGLATVAVAVFSEADGRFWDGTSFAFTDAKFLSADGLEAFTFPFPAAQFTADGVYRFTVRATDQAGNRTEAETAVTVDGTRPEVVLVAPAAGGVLNAAGFAAGVRGTAADATAGLASTTVAVQRLADGKFWTGGGFTGGSPAFLATTGSPAEWFLPGLAAAALTDGRYRVTVRTADRAGNLTDLAGEFTYDTVQPVPDKLTPEAGVGYNAANWTGALAGQVSDSQDTAAVSVTLRREADGLFWNGSFFGGDAGVPLPTVLSTAGGRTTWTYTFSPFGFPDDGAYTLTATATDAAGNSGTTVSRFTFDNTAPTSAVTAAAGGLFSPGTWPGKVAGTAADDLSGVSKVSVSLQQVATGRFFDGTGFTSATEVRLPAAVTPGGWSFPLAASSLPADGRFVLSSYALDGAGNTQAFGTPYPFVFDATPPQAVVTADKGAVTNVAPLAFTVAFTSPVTGLDTTGLVATNGTVIDATPRADGTFVVRVNPTADGPVTLRVTPQAARDAAGNPTQPAGPATGQFDRTPPTVVLTAPAGVLALGQPVVVTAEFSEPVTGFSAAGLTAANGTVVSVVGSGASYQITVLPAGPGPVTLALAGGATDAAGNPVAGGTSLSRTAEDPRYAVAVGGVARLYDRDNGLRSQFDPFGDGAAVRVAAGDFNGDGVPDVAVGSAPGRMNEVVVLDGKTGRELVRLTPFEEAFTGGVFVAAGDMNRDGVPELVITPDEGGGPRVRVFDGKTFGQLADFFGIADPDFRGGARAAVGDFDGDGVGDLAVAAGFGGGPRVAVFDGTTVPGGSPRRLVADFFAYETALRNGVYLAAGDLDGDGTAELVTAGGPGGGPRVTVFAGAELAAGRLSKTADFFAGDPTARSGVRVAVKQMGAGQPADLLVGDGANNTFRVYSAASLQSGTPTPSLDQDLLPGVAVGGVFVG
jgi:subtilisin-like proprotein convertase family protein